MSLCQCWNVALYSIRFGEGLSTRPWREKDRARKQCNIKEFQINTLSSPFVVLSHNVCTQSAVQKENWWRRKKRTQLAREIIQRKSLKSRHGWSGVYLLLIQQPSPRFYLNWIRFYWVQGFSFIFFLFLLKNKTKQKKRVSPWKNVFIRGPQSQQRETDVILHHLAARSDCALESNTPKNWAPDSQTGETHQLRYIKHIVVLLISAIHQFVSVCRAIFFYSFFILFFFYLSDGERWNNQTNLEWT